MNTTPTPTGEPLDELTTEQLLIAYRQLPRIPAGVNRSAIKDMERYLEEARRRDANNVELEAEFVKQLDKLDEYEAELAKLRAKLAERERAELSDQALDALSMALADYRSSITLDYDGWWERRPSLRIERLAGVNQAIDWLLRQRSQPQEGEGK